MRRLVKRRSRCRSSVNCFADHRKDLNHRRFGFWTNSAMSAARTAIAPEEENKIKVQNPRQEPSNKKRLGHGSDSPLNTIVRRKPNN